MPERLVIRRYGVKMCPCMIATLPMVEGRLTALGLIEHDLSGLIYQGCWNSGVAASAGTHDGGGAIDVHPSIATSDAALRAWRESGVAMWHRNPIPGLWGEHAHGIWLGCPHLSSGAEAQVAQYRTGHNGLANWGPDTGPDVPFITWQDALRKYENDERDWFDMATKDEIEDAMYNAMVRFVTKADVIGSPMPDGPARDKNPKWTPASIMRFAAAWMRETSSNTNKDGK